MTSISRNTQRVSSRLSNMSTNNNLERINKTIVFIGNSAVGKTSILTRFTKKNYREEYIETIGANYYTRENETEYGKVQFHLWDTAGGEIDDPLLPEKIYKTAEAFVIVCSYDNRESFTAIGEWIEYVERYKEHRNSCVDTNNHLLPIFIAINKCDLEKREFTREEVDTMCDEYNLNISIVEVSAMNNSRIDFMFLCITVALFGSYSDENLLNKPDINLTYDTLVNPKKKRFRIVGGGSTNKTKKNNSTNTKNSKKDKMKCC